MAFTKYLSKAWFLCGHSLCGFVAASCEAIFMKKPTDLDLHCLSLSMWTDEEFKFNDASTHQGHLGQKYVNIYQQSGLSNLTGWQLEVGVAS